MGIHCNFFHIFCILAHFHSKMSRRKYLYSCRPEICTFHWIFTSQKNCDQVRHCTTSSLNIWLCILHCFVCLYSVPFSFPPFSFPPFFSSSSYASLSPSPSASHHSFSFMPHSHNPLSNPKSTPILKSKIEVLCWRQEVMHRYIFKVSSLWWILQQSNGHSS